MSDPIAGGPFDLRGRRAVVTGGSRGLGKEISLALARTGCVVLVTSRNLDSCAAVAAEIRGTGGEAYAHACHVGHWDELPGLVDAAEELLGGIDILVNNAGMSPRYEGLATVSEELFDKVVGVNAKGPFRLAVLAAERMVEAGGGTIVNISSVSAVAPRPDALPYALAKAGLNASTVGLAHAYGPGVRVNAVMCGPFQTDVTKSWDPEGFAHQADTMALARIGRPEEIVGTILYLASDASSYTTGAVLRVDGGYTW
jgi:NAD(P)-dependent dehydrogenase (short-subunit alcohol dehydrogenase family)